MSLDILPDEVLLRIFDFYRMGHIHKLSEWRDLLLVCRRWYQLIVSSPRRLYLYVLCTRKTSFRKNLGHWPTFPIIIDYTNILNYPNYNTQKCSPDEEEEVFAALEHPDRISSLKLPVTKLLLEKVATMAQEQFPMLRELSFVSDEDESVPVLPSEFLGGCAPRLRTINLEGIPFPTLPILLSSATDLLALSLHRIPHAGYISPEAMVAGLAALTRLEFLYLEFQSSTSRPGRNDTSRRAALPTQVVLPALTSFTFRGASEYLEDLVAQVEAPRLDFISITYLDQLIFSEHELPRFVGRVEVLEQSRKSVHVSFRGSDAFVRIQQAENDQVGVLLIILRDLRRIRTQEPQWHVSDLAGLLSRCSAILSNVGDLSIDVAGLQPDGIGNIKWLEVLRQFTTVETLLVPAPLASYILEAFKEVTAEMASDTWPALRLLCLEYQLLRCVEGFVRARQLSGQPVTVVSEREVFLDLLRQTP